MKPLIVMLVLACSLVSEAQISPQFFGLESYIHRLGTSWGMKEPWPSVPFGTVRSWDTYSEWWQLEPARGHYQWNNLDWLLSQSEQHNTEFLYTFGMTPQWASSQPSNATCHLASEGAYGSCNPPASIKDWDNFVTALSTRYKGRIHYYELWNEPNLPAFWQGSLSQMLTMAEHAYKIIKSVDPTAVVLTPATAGAYGEPYMASYLAAGGGNYADVIAFHGYQETSEPRNAEKIVSCVNLYHQAMSRYGQSTKPLWDTEFSWEWTTNYPDPNLQAAYLAKGIVLQAASGVARATWFAWDTVMWGDLWSSTGGITIPGTAYTQVYDWLVGATLTGPCTEDASATWHCGLTRPGGYEAEITWNSTQTVSYSAPAQYTQYRDLAGHNFPLPTPMQVGNSPVLLETGASAPPSVTAQLSVNPTTGNAPLTVTADASLSYDSAGGSLVSSIDFGDGTVAPGPVASHTYRYNGAYNVVAIVHNNYGTTATANAPVQVGAATANFSITASPTDAAVSAGQNAVYTLLIAPQGNISQSVSLSCRVPATSVSCSLQPALLNVAGSPVSSVVTLKAITPAAASLPRRLIQPLLRTGTLAFGLPVFGIAFWGFEERSSRLRLKRIGIVLSTVLLALCFEGCAATTANTGGSATSSAYKVVVVANSAATSRSVTLNLTVR